MLIAYTNIVLDERAKLLWYTFVSAAVLSLHTYCSPYDRRESGLIGAAETFALTVRFFTFFVLTALLLFDAGPIFAWVLAGSMLLLNLSYVTFTFLQIGTEVVLQHAASVLRSVAVKPCTAALTSRLARRLDELKA